MKRLGDRTILFEKGVYITHSASVAGKKESEGPLGSTFDEYFEDDLLGENTWEKAESALIKKAITTCIKKAGKEKEDIDALLAGDLNAQIISSAFSARDLSIPFIGLYGACSTMTEGILVGSSLISSGALSNCIAAASSHFCTAERQFRTPLELGNQRPPYAQWTATAAGACLLEENKGDAKVVSGTIGRVIDLKIKDAGHMGAAMAPAVFDTLTGHLKDTGKTLEDYEMIVTGDLGIYGLEILKKLIKDETGIDTSERLFDCGANLYHKNQDAHAGGSGCGCIASVFSGHILNQIKNKKIKNTLVLGSGAMMSVTSSLQGESIPSVSYAVSVEGI